MTIVSGIVVFAVVWWLTFLMILPIGIKIDHTPEKGMATSAPLNPNILRKSIATTIITIGLWGLIFIVITEGWINLRP